MESWLGCVAGIEQVRSPLPCQASHVPEVTIGGDPGALYTLVSCCFLVYTAGGGEVGLGEAGRGRSWRHGCISGLPPGLCVAGRLLGRA